MEFYTYDGVQNGNYTIFVLFKSMGTETPERWTKSIQSTSNVNNVVELTNNEIYTK